MDTRTHSRWSAGALVLLAMLTFVPRNTPAGQVRPLNLEEMTQRAGTIVAGRCVEVIAEDDTGSGPAMSRLRFEVDRSVKGSPGDELSIRMLGRPRADGSGWSVAGLPRIRPGEEVVIFLYPESRSGLTSPVGFGQGVFSVVRDKHDRAIAINRFGNRDLFERLSPTATERVASVTPHVEPTAAPAVSLLLDLAAALRD